MKRLSAVDVQDRDMCRLSPILPLIAAAASLGACAPTPSPGDTQHCLRCHEKPGLRFKLPDGALYSLHVDGRLLGQSVHADLACHDCHTNYRQREHAKSGALRSGDRSVNGTAAELNDWLQHVRGHNRPAVAACIGCHLDQFEHYRKSTHAEALQAGSLDAPMCTDCHGNHYIRKHEDLESSTSRANVPATCAKCHADETVMRKYGVREATVITYRESFHGKKRELGSERAAACSSCHGYHEIYATDDPASPLHLSRRAEACGECHKVLGRRFALTFSHQPASQTSRPVVFWINTIFEKIAYLVILGLLLYTLGDMRVMTPMVRSQVRELLGQQPKAAKSGPHFQRWDIHQRLQHAIMLFSCLLLMVTGLPLHGSTSTLAHTVMRLLGGADTAAILHRVAGAAMGLAIAYHAAYLAVLFARGTRHTDMLPAATDVIAFYGALLHLVGRRDRPPKEGHYNVVEKFLYWAAGWGIIMMGVTGLVMWQSPWFAEHLSPQLVEICVGLHSHEALIASFALLVFHLYFAHLRPDVFPMSRVWLTGEIDEVELKERHALEYEKLRASKQVDD